MEGANAPKGRISMIGVARAIVASPKVRSFFKSVAIAAAARGAELVLEEVGTFHTSESPSVGPSARS